MLMTRVNEPKSAKLYQKIRICIEERISFRDVNEHKYSHVATFLLWTILYGDKNHHVVADKAFALLRKTKSSYNDIL